MLLCCNIIARPVAAKHLWNLQNADIRAVVGAISHETGKNFIIDPRVQGNISIVSSHPIGAKAAYQMFLSALKILGYSTVPEKGAISIVPNLDARSMPTKFSDATSPGAGPEMVVRVVPINHVSAMQLVPILRPLMPDWSSISAYNPSNMLILADSAANIERILKIIKRVDISSNSQIEIIQLQHASASKLVDAINKLNTANAGMGKELHISLAADDDNNAILMSGNKSDRLAIRVLISRLDSSNGLGNAVNTKVIHLNYLNAKKFAPILNTIATHEQQITTTKDKKAPNTTNADSKETVTADTETNSIIINAPHQELLNLLSIVRALDVKPTQVLVEAVIAQVDESMMGKLGIMWGTDGNNSLDNRDFQSGVGIIKHGSIRLLISALMGDSSSDILSTPSIVVLNNQKADIKVGKNVGIQNREYAQDTSSTYSGAPYNTYERKDVALSLNVTPHITPSNNIQLQIKQQNDTLQNPDNPGDNPIINTDQINTNVMVKDGTILVLGGLMNHNLTTNNSKIPILGDLPILGKLFQYKNKQLDKKNLVLFIRPIILHNQKQTNRLTEARYDLIRTRQLLKRQGIGLITNINEPPLLPSLSAPKLNLPSPFSTKKPH